MKKFVGENMKNIIKSIYNIFNSKSKQEDLEEKKSSSINEERMKAYKAKREYEISGNKDNK